MNESGKTRASDADVSAHQAQTRKLVGAMMKLTGMSATGLARAAGLTPSTVNRFMHQPVRHTLSQRTMLALMTETFQSIKGRTAQSLDAQALADLAPAIAVYERGILEVAPDVQTTLAAAKSAIEYPAPRAAVVPTDLPVIMASTRGIDVSLGDFAKAPLKTQRPPFLEGDAKAFAMLMPDESMMPRYDAGDMLYVSPARPLDGGKTDAVVERADGGFMVGTLSSANDETVRLVILSPRERVSFDRAKIRGVYRIVGVQRLSG
jgi:phage repressor protein C with HTH and peptisase S24 domain